MRRYQRDQQVIALSARGLSGAQIGRLFGVKRATISAILKKNGCSLGHSNRGKCRMYIEDRLDQIMSIVWPRLVEDSNVSGDEHNQKENFRNFLRARILVGRNLEENFLRERNEWNQDSHNYFELLWDNHEFDQLTKP